MVTKCSLTEALLFTSQMLQHLAKVDHQLVFRETHHYLQYMMHTDQVLSLDLSLPCVYISRKALQISFLCCLYFRYHLLRDYREVGAG